MSILFIADDLINPFKFLYNGHLATGMHFRSELWGRVLVAPCQERQRFFQTIEALGAQGIDVMITASKEGYEGWLNLRSPLADSLVLLGGIIPTPVTQASRLQKAKSPQNCRKTYAARY